MKTRFLFFTLILAMFTLGHAQNTKKGAVVKAPKGIGNTIDGKGDDVNVSAAKKGDTSGIRSKKKQETPKGGGNARKLNPPSAARQGDIGIHAKAANAKAGATKGAGVKTQPFTDGLILEAKSGTKSKEPKTAK